MNTWCLHEYNICQDEHTMSSWLYDTILLPLWYHDEAIDRLMPTHTHTHICIVHNKSALIEILVLFLHWAEAFWKGVDCQFLSCPPALFLSIPIPIHLFVFRTGSSSCTGWLTEELKPFQSRIFFLPPRSICYLIHFLPQIHPQLVICTGWLANANQDAMEPENDQAEQKKSVPRISG